MMFFSCWLGLTTGMQNEYYSLQHTPDILHLCFKIGDMRAHTSITLFAPR